MRINNITGPSFKAIYISRDTKIGKFQKDFNLYNEYSANFAEIETSNEHDIDALYNIAESWQGQTYATGIYNNAYAKSKGSSFYNKHRFYILTTQNDESNKLDSKSILGIADVQDIIPDKITHISHLQVNPEYLDTDHPEYRGIGSAIIRVLQDKYEQISLSSTNSYSVKEFYRKNGFTEEQHNNHFTWVCDIFRKIGIR